MSLKLNLGGIHLEFCITRYHRSTKENPEDKWCKVDMSLKSHTWLNYTMTDYEYMRSSDVDKLTKKLQELKNGTLKAKTLISFIEPDITFLLYPKADKQTPHVYWVVHFWKDNGELSANDLTLHLDSLDVANLLNYLRHVQSEGDKEYVPVTGDGLTEKQLSEELEKAEEDVRAGRVYPAKEVFENLRKRIEQ